MSDERCENCRFWTHHVYKKKFDVPNHMGSCSCEKIAERGTHNLIGNEYPDDGLVYYDYEGLSDCGFDTGENFGCVHWKKKEEHEN